MGLWKIVAVCLACCSFVVLNHAKAQKKWDGEAGDGLWGSEKNWYPDGIPDSSETVILDNTFIPHSYGIMISSDTCTVKLQSLIIQPEPNKMIEVEIPLNNKAVPALSLFSNKISIKLGSGAILINKSSATAGNTIMLSGKIRIENGGKYSHQTIRGNAYMISKLETSIGTERGIVEFDVPGNTNYPISVSGRQFGSLWLNSTNKEKRNYTGTGNNELLIRGDLMIGNNASFNASLTGNISISGDLNNKGNLYINPSTADSINREIIFTGDDAEFYSTGSLDLGEHFNAVRVKKGALQLRSSMHISGSNHLFVLDPHTRLMMDTFCVYGNGKFKSDNNSVIGIASPDGISIDATKGNIRTSHTNISPKTSFIFYGDQEQVTGSSFPSSIASAEIIKTKGDVHLSSGLMISDSLILSKGIIHSSASKPLLLAGIVYSKGINHYGWPCGSDSSFIDGPLSVRFDTMLTGYFPVGRGGVFAPAKITVGNTTNTTIEVAYLDSITISLNNMLPPLRSINQQGFWKIATNNNDDTVIHSALVELGIGQHRTHPASPPMIATADTITSTWTIIENCIYDQVVNMISGKTLLKTSVLTLGSIHDEILSQKRIDLTYRKKADMLVLKWMMHGDIKFKEILIQKSRDGIQYKTVVRYKGKADNTNHYHYEEKLIPDHQQGTYFRIVCLEEPSIIIISNVIYIRNRETIDRPYPNPASNEIMIRLPENDDKRGLTVQMRDNYGRRMPVSISRHRGILVISTNKIKQGVYHLQVQNNGETINYSFIKN